MKHLFKIICFLAVCVLIILYMVSRANSAEPKLYVPEYDMPDTPEDLIIEEITTQAFAYGVDPRIALDIARCESKFNPYATNAVSGAKGIFQFKDSTWEFIKASGHQYDWKENIKQFMIWYDYAPQWWKECSKDIKA